MTYQQPIFDAGLFGKANRFVCNSWTDAAAFVGRNAEGIEWAQAQLGRGAVPTRWLARVTKATSIGVDRWTYEFESIVLTDTHTAQATAGSFGKGTGAINLREIGNDGLKVDGSPKPGGASVGPVGSSWLGSSWNPTLSAVVEMNLVYDSTGAAAWWFSSPNPVRCGP
jgi:hypothetical protein